MKLVTLAVTSTGLFFAALVFATNNTTPPASVVADTIIEKILPKDVEVEKIPTQRNLDNITPVGRVVYQRQVTEFSGEHVGTLFITDRNMRFGTKEHFSELMLKAELYLKRIGNTNLLCINHKGNTNCMPELPLKELYATNEQTQVKVNTP